MKAVIARLMLHMKSNVLGGGAFVKKAQTFKILSAGLVTLPNELGMSK